VESSRGRDWFVANNHISDDCVAWTAVRGSFLKKRTKKLLFVDGVCKIGAKDGRTQTFFCCFFSKKQALSLLQD
jgi:hypothetical protein